MITYYVSPWGFDNNSGLSADYPFETTKKALDVIISKLKLGDEQIAINLADGTLIVISPGNYRWQMTSSSSAE